MRTFLLVNPWIKFKTMRLDNRRQVDKTLLFVGTYTYRAQEAWTICLFDNIFNLFV